MKKKFYITGSIPYVNARPHVGLALEFAQTDTIARYHRLLGEEVLTLSGADENALKNVQAAEKAGQPIQEFIDMNNVWFEKLAELLNTKFDVWQRGSDQKTHFPASQKLWKLCKKDIYKKKYKGLYCVGCEMFYEKEELDEKGECWEHPGKKLDEVEEENYFFKLSKYEKEITGLVESGEVEIVPRERKNEVLAFLKGGLQDLSISRSNERARNWGVPVPGDPTQRMYVWFDALNIYQSGIGFGWNEDKYEKWWPADVHVIGKGIIRFHAVYWPAFLLSAGLKLPKKLFVHGYYTVNGQKMSKTLGNVYDPIPLLEKYGADPLRYFCLAKTPPFTDGDFSEEKFVEAYNSDLANGLGNLVSRVAKLAEKCTDKHYHSYETKYSHKKFEELRNLIEEFRFNDALTTIWNWIKEIDVIIERFKPWTIKDQKEYDFIVLTKLCSGVVKIGEALQPFIPETAQKILEQFKGPKIMAGTPLFPRIK